MRKARSEVERALALEIDEKVSLMFAVSGYQFHTFVTRC